ncbi:hypothetical protein ACFQY0_02255 [Haloferula chungangensis]|uniref:Uncharacterized protein n=1 Tax=Haloferula chungangensis TaxID=1048331 RepID=A0ABW2L3C7_9BACT
MSAKRQSVGINVLDFRVHRERWTRFPKPRAAASRLRLSVPSVFAGAANNSESVAFGNEASHRAWGNGWWDFHSDTEGNAQRIPSWLLWDKLYREGGRAEVVFSRADGSDASETVQSLLGLYFKERGGLERSGAERRYVIGMPDSFREEHQETLLRHLPWGRQRTQLLWRSVASVLGASASADDLGVTAFEADDEVLVVDIQNEYVEATVLRILDSESGATYPSALVPIRSVPSPECHWRSEHSPVDLLFGARLFADIPGLSAEECLSLVWGQNGVPRLSDPNRLPTHEFVISTENGLRERSFDQELLAMTMEDAVGTSPDSEERVVLKRIKEKVGFGAPCTRSVAESLNELCAWACDLKRKPQKILLSGAITRLVGTFSGELDVLTSALRPLIQQGAKIVNDSVDLEADLVSVGCAHWGALDERGFPGYFEYLEPFSIIGRGRSGKKVEYSLLKLENDECLATGGKEYRNTDLMDVALINKGQPLVRFWFKKGEDHKKVDQRFDPPPDADCRLSFDITMVPSQGFARVEIIPSVPDVFKGRRLLLDWDRMVELTKEEMEGQMSYPIVMPVAADPDKLTRKLSLIKNYIRAGKLGKSASVWSPAEGLLSSLGKALQNGRVLGSTPSHPLVGELIEVLSNHYGMFGNFRMSDWENDEIGKALLRTASSLFHRTPEWARVILFDYMAKKRKEDPGNPRPQVVLLNCCGRCFSSEEEVQVFVKSMIARFAHQLDDYDANPGASGVGMDNWCRGLQTILRINEEANLCITLDQAEELQFLLRRLIELERTRNYRGPRRPGVSRPCQNAMLSIFYLLRVRGRGDGGEFLAPGTNSMEAIEAAVEAVNMGQWKWVPRGVPVGEDQSFQGSLLKFIRMTATMKDVRIIASGEEEMEGSD